jgi:hypothetical protein
MLNQQYNLGWGAAPTTLQQSDSGGQIGIVPFDQTRPQYFD